MGGARGTYGARKMLAGLCCGEPHLEVVSVNRIILKRIYKVVERGLYPCV